MNPNQEKFYRSFGLEDVPYSFKKRQEVFNLFLKPKKETKEEAPRFYSFVKDDTHQADILHLPHDVRKVNGKKIDYAYALVITDMATGLCDAEPMPFHEGWKAPKEEDVISGVQKIYGRKYLKFPAHITTDSGKEFGDKFRAYFAFNKTSVRKALPGRHRQLGLVERKNRTIGRILFMRMFAQETLTGEPSREWVDDLPIVIEKMNLKYGHKPYTDKELLKHFDPWKNLKQKILPLGTPVRIALDEPRNYKETKLSGRFRDTDQRWYQNVYHITGYVFDPHEPILYKTDKPLNPHEKVAYSIKQLQVVKPNEEDAPAHLVVRNQNSKGEFAIKKLLEKRTSGNRTEYKILWKGYPLADATWQYKSKIPKSFVDAYEKNH